MLVLAIVAWALVGIIFAFLGRTVASERIGLPSFLVVGMACAIAGGFVGAGFGGLFGAALLGATLGGLVGVALVGSIGEVRTKGPTLSS